jgi:hypothetical protein
MKWFIRILLIACFVISCGHSIIPFHYIKNAEYVTVPVRVVGIWIDKEFGVRDQLSIDDAIKQWNYALNGYVRLDVKSTTFDMEPNELAQIRSCDCWIIMKVKSDNPMIPDEPIRGKPQYHTLAWVNEIGGKLMWVVRDRLQNEWMTGVILHEMGHMLGARHDKVYLMQPSYSWEDYRCVDKWTLGQVAAYQQIPVRMLNYCEYGANVNLPIDFLSYQLD